MTKEIPLTQGKVALVDDEDFKRVSQYKWHAYCPNQWRGSNKYYAATSTRDACGKNIIIPMHRFLIGANEGLEVDHINLNTLDNRKSNLRQATRLQNSQNSSMKRTNTSGFKGASYDIRAKRWKSKIGYMGNQISIGYYETPELAARAYDAKAKELFGEFARLNFPNE